MVHGQWSFANEYTIHVTHAHHHQKPSVVESTNLGFYDIFMVSDTVWPIEMCSNFNDRFTDKTHKI